MTENPEDWKSTVDPSTGRVYWYHRRTRVSTWVKPNFKESGVEEYSHPITSSTAAGASTTTTTTTTAAVASASSAVSTNNTIYGTSDKSIINGKNTLLGSAGGGSANANDTNHHNNNNTNTNNKHQPIDRYDITSTLSSDLTFNEVQIDTPLRFRSSHNIVQDEYQLDQLYEAIIITSPDELSDNQALLSDLIDFVIADFLVDVNSMEWNIALIQRGHQLAASFVLALASAALRDEERFTLAMNSGVLSSLQQTAISKGLEEDVRKTARRLLAAYISSSSNARDGILDAFLEMSASLAEIPLPNGPEPAVYQHEISLQDETGKDLWIHLKDSGSLDIADQTPEIERLERLLLQRDVEWIPQSGTSWQLSSALLWARCPALHEIIQGFWEQGGGCLELTIDSSDQVVASVCHYIHSGLLRLPPTVTSQLELLRVSAQLGMDSLQKVVEDAITLRIKRETLPEVVSFCREHHFENLAAMCQAAAQSTKKPVLRLQSFHESQINNVTLKNAIYESLQDVSAILKQSQDIPESTTTHGHGGRVGLLKEPKSSTTGWLDDSSDIYSDNLFSAASNGPSLDKPSSFASSMSPAPTGLSKSGLKPKSGGIYSLLLQQQGESTSTATPLDTAKMPGKVMPDKEGALKKSTGKKAPPPGDSRVKNRKAGKPPIEHSEDDLLNSTMESSAMEESILHIEGLAISEYRTGMSLEPPREKSEREKRWERMAQPKHSREPKAKSKTDSKKKDIKGDAPDGSLDQSLDHSPLESTATQAPVPVQGKGNHASVNNKKKPPLPIVDHSSVVTAITTKTMPTSDEADPYHPQDEETEPPKNVRSSLALLKAKTTARSRRRGSLLTAREEDVPDSSLPPPLSVNSKDSEMLSHMEPRSAWSTQSLDQPSFEKRVEESYDYDYQEQQQPREKLEREESFFEDDEGEDGYDKWHEGNYGDEGEGGDDGELQSCPDCGRRFLPSSLARHIRICQKVFQKKRKVFDSAKKRVEGIPELQELLGRKSRTGKQPSGKTQALPSSGETKASKWKAQSEAFRAAMRAMKATDDDSGPTRANRPSQPYIDPSLIQCPHCQRRFNEQAAARHIPLCQNIIAKPSSLKKGSGTMTSSATATLKTPNKRGWQ
eukprot:scaffold167_cov168-Ochromonas_danica.AAC.13